MHATGPPPGGILVLALANMARGFVAIAPRRPGAGIVLS